MSVFDESDAVAIAAHVPGESAAASLVSVVGDLRLITTRELRGSEDLAVLLARPHFYA